MPIPNVPRGGASRVNNSAPSTSSNSNVNESDNDLSFDGLPSLEELDGGSSNVSEEDTFSNIPVSEVSSESSRNRRRTYTPPDLSDLDDDDDDDEDSVIAENIDDDDEEVETRSSKRKPVKPSRGAKNSKASKTSRPSKKTSINLSKDENNKDNTFVDTKNMKLKPFGEREGGKRKAKVSEFDERKNLRRQQQIRSMAILGVLGIIMLMGIKNAVIPPKTLNEAQVQNIVTQTVGDTGFPLNSGRGFVENFMKAYLNQGANDLVADKVLSYYYTGSMSDIDSNNNPGNSLYSSDFQLKTLYGPTIFSTSAITSSSANYTVGALTVSQTTKSAAPSDGSTAKWTFFNVNVYYNKDTNSFKITKDSPTVIPPINIADNTIVPQSEPLGSKIDDDSVKANLQPVIQGYVQGYATSNPQSHSSLDQYVTSTSDNTLATGLNSRYKLAGDINEAVTFNLFNDSTTPGVIKAQVKVIWQEDADVENNIQFTSNYVMTLNKQANGKYLVSKFAPEYFVPGAAQ